MGRQIQYFVVGLLLLVFNSADDNSTDVRLQNLYADYCTIQNLFECRRNRESCCIGCSCHPNCGLTGTCCHINEIKETSIIEDRNDLIDSGSLKCLYPNTRKTNNERFFMYQFIVDPPIEGCIGTTTCNQSDSLVLWKTFQPIFSREKMANYLNEGCAKCHGVTDGLKWNSRLVMKAAQSFDITSTVQYLIDNPEKSNMLYIIFEHPGEAIERIQTMCLTDKAPTCLKDANQNLPYYTTPKNISTEDIKAKCWRNFDLPTTANLYKTEICAFCKYFIKEEDCETFYRTDTTVYFTTIVDYTFVERIGREVGLQNGKTACKIKTNDGCREVFCPALQARNTNGKCEYPTETCYFDRVGIYLNLTASLHNRNSPSFQNMSEIDILDAFQKTSPWNNCWIINKIVSRTYRVETKEIIEFVVFQMCNIQSVNPRRFLTTLQKSLSSIWPINLDDIRLSCNQAVARYPLTPYIEGSFVPMWYESMLTLSRGNKSRLSGPIWNGLVNKKSDFQKFIAITKLFFCNQVHLKEDEYVFNGFLFTLELANRSKTLYRYDISLTYLDKRVIYVCIEDLDLEIVRDENGGSYLLQPNFYKILMVVQLITSWN